MIIIRRDFNTLKGLYRNKLLFMEEMKKINSVFSSERRRTVHKIDFLIRCASFCVQEFGNYMPRWTAACCRREGLVGGTTENVRACDGGSLHRPVTCTRVRIIVEVTRHEVMICVQKCILLIVINNKEVRPVGDRRTGVSRHVRRKRSTHT